MASVLWFLAGLLTGAGVVIYFTYLGIDITDDITIELFTEEEEGDEE